MKVETLGFYLENLLPGVVILYGILLLLPSTSGTYYLITQLQISEFLLSVLFITFAYVLGLISAMLSRVIVDNLSELFPRPFFLALSTCFPGHLQYTDLKEEIDIVTNKLPITKAFISDDQKRKDNKKFQKIFNKDVRKGWNNIYREALRFGKEIPEVQRRREQGRLVRNLFFPLIIISLVLSRLYGFHVDIYGSILFACGMGVTSILLYAYAEYFIFIEACLYLKK
jgi:hypothetical protein